MMNTESALAKCLDEQLVLGQLGHCCSAVELETGIAHHLTPGYPVLLKHQKYFGPASPE